MTLDKDEHEELFHKVYGLEKAIFHPISSTAKKKKAVFQIMIYMLKRD
jgi:hypothetical protein